MDASDPLEFVDKANADPEVNRRIQVALERGASISAKSVMEIAEELGFEFTRDEFESAVRASIQKRFADGEIGLADAVAVSKKEPLESSCAKGCLSYTKSWHPSRDFEYSPLSG